MKDTDYMNAVFPICRIENRQLDGFDMLFALGLIKEYNWKELWKRYLPDNHSNDTISMYGAGALYFMETHIQKMQRIILSEKFNTNPFFMQQVIQRMLAGHSHELILDKIRKQGIDTGDNPVSLSCSMGSTIVDFIAHKNEPFDPPAPGPFGNTAIEKAEQRSLDVYDLSSILYLCQQNLSDAIYKRYGSLDSNGQLDDEVCVETKVGKYSIKLVFRKGAAAQENACPDPGNISVATLHQVLQRMNFNHPLELIRKEFEAVGVSIESEKLEREFSLSRVINNTSLLVDFQRNAAG